MCRASRPVTVGDLVAATGAAGGEEGGGRRRAHFRQNAKFADLQRHFMVFGLVAEGASHAAAGRIEGLDRQIGDQLQCLDRGADSGKGLLVAMAVQQRRFVRHRALASA